MRSNCNLSKVSIYSSSEYPECDSTKGGVKRGKGKRKRKYNTIEVKKPNNMGTRSNIRDQK